MVIIEPLGGLCNRMRAVNSAYTLAGRRGDALLLVWRKNAELNCRPDGLFNLPDDVNVIVLDNFLKRLVWKVRFRMTKCRWDDVRVLQGREPENCCVREQDLKGKVLYFKTGQQFFAYSDWKFFSPKREIVQKVRDTLGEKTSPLIGIHIRRTDNRQAIEGSSLDGFLAAMDAETEKDPSVRFFLATDDKTVEGQIVERYGKRVITRKDKKLDRNDSDAIKDAYIDVLCLAGTDRILGSFYSSFSEVSALIGNISLEIIR